MVQEDENAFPDYDSFMGRFQSLVNHEMIVNQVLLPSAACNQQPEQLELFCRREYTRPDGFEEFEEFSDWPSNGVLIVYMRLPSSTRNMNDP